MNNIKSSASCYIHKELPLDDEELSCRHSAETLVCRDEEEGTHPADTENKQTNNECDTTFLVCLSVIKMLVVSLD